MGSEDAALIGLTCNVIGVFFLANSIIFRKPRRVMEEFFGERSRSLTTIKDYVLNKIQVVIGFLFLTTGFVLQGVRAWRGSENVAPVVVVCLSLLAFAATLYLVGSLYSRKSFRRYLREFFRHHAWSFKDDMALTKEIGTYLGIQYRVRRDRRGLRREGPRRAEAPEPGARLDRRLRPHPAPARDGPRRPRGEPRPLTGGSCPRGQSAARATPSRAGRGLGARYEVIRNPSPPPTTERPWALLGPRSPASASWHGANPASGGASCCAGSSLRPASSAVRIPAPTMPCVPSAGRASHHRAGILCRRCGEPLPPLPAGCAGCRARRPRLQWARAPFVYRGTGGSLVRGLKFRRNTAAGVFLAHAMATHLLATEPPGLRDHVLVPIPVHRSRRRKRGFDQAVWLAERLAERLGLPLFPGALVRVRLSLPQGDPRTVSRRRNVEGAFAAGRSGPPPGSRILLVDDVTTSGETAAECSRVLSHGGAASVALVTACRARQPGSARER